MRKSLYFLRINTTRGTVDAYILADSLGEAIGAIGELYLVDAHDPIVEARFLSNDALVPTAVMKDQVNSDRWKH